MTDENGSQAPTGGQSSNPAPGAKPGRRQRLDPAEIEKQLGQMSRAPFQQSLARVLGCEPTEEALQQFAEKHPDRWAQTVSILAKLAGYSDKLQVDHRVLLSVQHMSDAELVQRLTQIEHDLAAVQDQKKRQPETIEAASELAQGKGDSE